MGVTPCFGCTVRIHFLLFASALRRPVEDGPSYTAIE
jgi:hypothetical protein